ncbi:MAG: phage tail tube protein [Pseudomonadota bacterium]
MAASEAVVAFEVTLEVETSEGSGVYTELAEITNITPPSATINDVEVTHMKSPGRAREFKPGLTDYGTATFEMNWIPGSATETFILAWRAAGETRSVRLTYGDTLEVDTFPAYPQSWERGAQIGEKMSGSLTVKVAGDVVRS